jgi:hypothetical protein
MSLHHCSMWSFETQNMKNTPNAIFAKQARSFNIACHQDCHCPTILITQGFSHSASRTTLLWTAVKYVHTGGRVFSWKKSAGLIPVHCSPRIKLFSNTVWQESKAGPSVRVYDLRCRCLNLGSSMHLFELEHMEISTPDFVDLRFKGCDWPPFCECQGEQIYLLLIPRVNEA